MALIFQGADELNLDAKGRIVIPARQRDALIAVSGGQLVLTLHPHYCLLLFPAPSWEPNRDRLSKVSSLNSQAAYIKRMLLGNARDETMDSTGRLLIAPELRKLARFEKKVWLVGQGGHFEIWSEAGWKQQQEVFYTLGDQGLPSGLEDLVL